MPLLFWILLDLQKFFRDQTKAFSILLIECQRTHLYFWNFSAIGSFEISKYSTPDEAKTKLVPLIYWLKIARAISRFCWNAWRHLWKTLFIFILVSVLRIKQNSFKNLYRIYAKAANRLHCLLIFVLFVFPMKTNTR